MIASSLLLAPLLCAAQQNAAAQDPLQALARAVSAQVTDERSHRVEHFALDLVLRELGETPREVDVTLFFDGRRGGRLQLVLDDSDRGGVRVEKGFDGEHYWLKEQDQPAIELAGRDYAHDRDTLDDTLDLCEQLLLLFDLEQLQARAKELSLSAPRQIEIHGESLPHVVLSGAIRLADRPYRFALMLEQQSWLPSRLVLTPVREGEDAASEEDVPSEFDAASESALPPPEVQEFDLAYYHDFPLFGSEEPQGRLLPRRIWEFRRGADGQRREVRILELHEAQWRLPPRFSKVELGG